MFEILQIDLNVVNCLLISPPYLFYFSFSCQYFAPLMTQIITETYERAFCWGESHVSWYFKWCVLFLFFLVKNKNCRGLGLYTVRPRINHVHNCCREWNTNVSVTEPRCGPGFMGDGGGFMFLICIYFLRYFSGHHTPPLHTLPTKIARLVSTSLFFRLLTDNFIVALHLLSGCVSLMEHGKLQRPQNVNDSCLGVRQKGFFSLHRPQALPARRPSVPAYPELQHFGAAGRIGALV